MTQVIYDEQLHMNIYVFSTGIYDIIEFSMSALRERVIEVFNFDINTILN